MRYYAMGFGLDSLSIFLGFLTLERLILSRGLMFCRFSVQKIFLFHVIVIWSGIFVGIFRNFL